MATAKDAEKIASAIETLANRVGPHQEWLRPGKDAAGGPVACLTEAVMGNTAALVMIEEAIREQELHRVADALETIAAAIERAAPPAPKRLEDILREE